MKRGRKPIFDTAMRTRFTVRLTEETARIVSEYAWLEDMNLSEVVREGLVCLAKEVQRGEASNS